MKIVIPITEQVRRIARQSLRDNFPLYEEAHVVDAVEECTSKVRLAYRTTEDVAEKVNDSTHLDIEFWFPRLCFLNSIAIARENVGKGIGLKLYQTVEDIARNLGCEILSQTPSGSIVVNGRFVETRESYLIRKLGYKPGFNGNVDKKL